MAKKKQKTKAKKVATTKAKSKAKSRGAVSTARPATRPVSTAAVQPISSGFKGVTPLGDRVLVKPFLASEGEVKNSFGIIIPDTASKEQPEQGEVVAVGPGRFDSNSGKIVPMKVKVGDVVIFSKYGFDEVKIDEKELYIIKEENILAVVKKHE